MKKRVKKIINKITNFYTCKPIFFLFLFIVISSSFFISSIVDNDFWFISNTGRYILKNGFPIVEPFTIHENFAFVVQQWGTDVLFYSIYNVVGYVGIIILIMLVMSGMTFMLYKICMVVSEKKINLSVLICFFTLCFFSFGFLRSRPQIFDYLFLLIELYCLEKYIRTSEKKYLVTLPILSILFINLHASTWFMLHLFMIPYLIDSFKFEFLIFRGEGYKKKGLFITFFLMILVGLINPYGIKAITYIFTSFGHPYVNNYILEMKPIFHDFNVWAVSFVAISLVLVITNIVFYKKIKIRYLCLQIGTIILAVMNIRSFPVFLMGSTFSLAYYYKDYFKVKNYKYHYSNKFKAIYLMIVIIIFTIPISITLILKGNKKYIFMLPKIASYMEKNVPKETAIVFTDYNVGDYFEWIGYKVYIDSRAEVFYKANNKKEEIFDEFYFLMIGKISPENFCNKYNFTHLIVPKKSNLQKYLKKSNDYKELVYDKGYSGSDCYYLYEKKK